MLCFRFFDENNGDNILMFSVVADQCLHRAKYFSASCVALPVTRLVVHKDLGGDGTRTADPEGPKGCPMLYGIMLSNKTWEKKGGRGYIWSDGIYT